MRNSEAASLAIFIEVHAHPGLGRLPRRVALPDSQKLQPELRPPRQRPWQTSMRGLPPPVYPAGCWRLRGGLVGRRVRSPYLSRGKARQLAIRRILWRCQWW